METKDIIYELRTKKGLSQEELAEKIFVTRQAVSRWETGETIPNIDTLKLLSKLFDVSINTLLGSPRDKFLFLRIIYKKLCYGRAFCYVGAFIERQRATDGRPSRRRFNL